MRPKKLFFVGFRSSFIDEKKPAFSKLATNSSELSKSIACRQFWGIVHQFEHFLYQIQSYEILNPISVYLPQN
ncbi:MAG: hypothetical protein ACJAWV_002918 [Flammeovirgaceae bacterium]|jgi:hypothetical protein